MNDFDRDQRLRNLEVCLMDLAVIVSNQCANHDAMMAAMTAILEACSGNPLLRSMIDMELERVYANALATNENLPYQSTLERILGRMRTHLTPAQEAPRVEH